MKYPVITFVHVDEPDVQDSVCGLNFCEEPVANSTIIEPSQFSIRASLERHDDQSQKCGCHGSLQGNSCCKGCKSHSTSQCPQSRDCQFYCKSLPRSSVPHKTKTQCKPHHSESKGCKSQCSSAPSPRALIDRTPCTPLAQTYCGSTPTPRDNQSHCSSRNSVPRSCQSKWATHSVTKRNLTQYSNSPVIEPISCQTPRECPDECSSYDVGHVSHIPRIPPTPSTYEIPSIALKNVATGTCTDYNQYGDIFGMVKLGENDVCYTSGTIEWVGRKRSYPINTGFKLLNETNLACSNVKKVKTLDQTYTCNIDKTKDCDCADVLPTMNAIVDHLNALHEAVDIVDLRLNTIENVMTRNN